MRNHKKILALLVFLSLFPFRITPSEHPLTKIRNPHPLSSTVIVPCHHAHAQFLYDVLLSYADQTVLPDEVIISLSGTDNVHKTLIDSLTKESWPFKMVLLLSEDPQTEGQNRNNASQNATGQILICHDADDFPSRQRVEIIRYFFENYDIAHLLHSYNLFQPDIEIEKFEVYQRTLPDFVVIREELSLDNAREQHLHCSDFTQIRKVLCHTVDDIWRAGIPVGFGFCAIRKEAFDTGCHWINRKEIGTDLRFTELMLNTFEKTLAIEAPIYHYRPYNSAYIYSDMLLEKMHQNQLPEVP